MCTRVSSRMWAWQGLRSRARTQPSEDPHHRKEKLPTIQLLTPCTPAPPPSITQERSTRNTPEGGGAARVHPRKFTVLALLACCVHDPNTTHKKSQHNVIMEVKLTPCTPASPPSVTHGTHEKEEKQRVCTRVSTRCWLCLRVVFLYRTQRTRRASTGMRPIIQ